MEVSTATSLSSSGADEKRDAPSVNPEVAESGSKQEGQSKGDIEVQRGSGLQRPEPYLAQQPRKSLSKALRERWSETVTHEEATIPLAWQALLTGLVDALIYGRSSIWTGFQTGNMVQFSQNIAQYMLPGAERYPLMTVERTVSIVSFLLGGFLGAKGGSRFGDRKRGWQATSAVIQSVFLFGASAILLTRPELEPPNFQFWPAVIALTAFSMGLQSIAAQKLVSPAFATTVAFTATLSQIASDPYLFALTLSPIESYRREKERKKQASSLEGAVDSGHAGHTTKPPKTLGRDRRMLGIFALCVGAGVAECLLHSRAGLGGGLTIAAGFKLILAILWFTAARGERTGASKLA